MGVRVGVDPAFHGVECKYSGDNSCGVSNDKARVCGLWMRVVGRLEAGGQPTQHGVGVLLLQISWCRPSKQYKPYSTIFFVCESVGGTINALTFYTTCSQLLEVMYRPSCIPVHPLGARGYS